MLKNGLNDALQLFIVDSSCDEEDHWQVLCLVSENKLHPFVVEWWIIKTFILQQCIVTICFITIAKNQGCWRPGLLMVCFLYFLVEPFPKTNWIKSFEQERFTKFSPSTSIVSIFISFIGFQELRRGEERFECYVESDRVWWSETFYFLSFKLYIKYWGVTWQRMSTDMSKPPQCLKFNFKDAPLQCIRLQNEKWSRQLVDGISFLLWYCVCMTMDMLLVNKITNKLQTLHFKRQQFNLKLLAINTTKNLGIENPTNREMVKIGNSSLNSSPFSITLSTNYNFFP